MWYSVMGNLVYTEDSGGFVLVLLYGIIRYNILFLTYSTHCCTSETNT